MRPYLALVLLGCASTSTVTPPVELARAAARAGDRLAAYEAFARAVCAAPDDLALAREYVEAWDALGRPGQATTRLDGCALGAVLLPYVDGLGRATAGDLVGAAPALDQALTLASGADKAEVSYRRGLVALRAGDTALAHRALDTSAALAPLRVDIRVAAAQVLVAEQRFGDVVPSLREILKLSPSATELDRARAVLRSAVRASQPPLDEASAGRVKAWLATVERGEVTTADYASALELAGTTPHPRVLTAAGILALRVGAKAEGAAFLLRAAELAPMDADPLRALGFSLYAEEAMSDALPYLEALATRDPFDVAAARMLAAAALARGNKDLGRATYERLAALSPDVAEYQLWLARLEHERGDLAKAEEAARRGCDLAPSDVPLLFERAAIETDLLLHAPADARGDAASRAKLAIEALAKVAPDHPGVAALRTRAAVD